MHRREAIGAVGATLIMGIAGCSSVGRNTIYETTETTTLNEDDYSWYNFNIEETSTVDYTIEVTKGPNIDVILMDRGSFQAYQNGNYDAATYYNRMSDINTAFAEAEGDMSAGSYTLMLDNTSVIGTSPPTNFQDDVVLIEVDFSVYR